MTCKDIMTPNPACCLPSDSVAIAAQIMKRNDIGPVLVVSDHHENRLVGIVTDRDLVLKVVADGRDAQTTRVDEVMSLNPVCCREDEETHRALQLMANHQVRRIPVVDQNNRLCGIVAQADIALHEDEEEVGRVVEHISEPYGSAGWTEGSHTQGVGWAGASPVAAAALCAGLGATVMYLLDPSRGTIRRTRLQERGSSLCSACGQALGRKSTDLKNRAAGVVASAKSFLKDEEEVPDQKLIARVRSKLGHQVSHSHAVQVTATDGAVTVSGPILANEVRNLLDSVSGVPGVKSVNSRLDVFETSSGHPALQGGRRQRDEGDSGGWSPASRLIAGIAGGGLLLYCMRASSGLMQSQEENRNLTGAQGY